MASLKQIVLDGSYIQINRCQISSADERTSKIGIALKRSFSMGPAAEESVVTISSRRPDALAPDEEDKTSQQDNQETQSQEGDQDQTQSNDTNQGSDTQGTGDNSQQDSGSSSEQSSSEEHHESFHYSILKAYNNMHPVFEDDEPSGEGGDPDSGGSPSESPDEPANPQDGDSDSSDEPSPEESDDKKDDDSEEDNKFSPGSELYVQVLLKGEGCTIWHIQLDSRVNNLSAIINQLSSKSFKAALGVAKKGLNSDGLVPLSATTYVKKDAAAGVPFMGHCRYAIDSGSENAENDSNTVVIAVAPIDGITKKPSESTVYKVSYEIKGDITDDKMPFLNDLKNTDDVTVTDATDTAGDSEGSSVSAVVSQWLNGKHKLGKPDFTSVGNSSMYDNFVKIRDFVVKNTKKMNGDVPCLDLNKDDSENPKHYAKIPDVKKSLIYY